MWAKTEIRPNRFVDRREVARREQIRPSVVVVVEEPGRKTAAGPRHACRSRHLGERVVVIVPIQKVVPVEIRDVEVHESVVVIVRRAHTLGERDAIDTGSARDVFEGTAALVQEQLRGAILVADEQIEQSIVVDIRPRRGLRARRRLCQSACRRHIGEGAVAVVPQQRLALGHLPPAAQHQDVLAAVVVVVGLNHVQPAQLAVEPRCGRPFGERAVAVVAEVVQRTATVEVGRDDVEAPVAGEIVDDDASRRRDDIETGLRSHVAETPDVFGGRERGRRNQIGRRNLVGIPADGHVREIEKPSHLEVVGLLLQEIQEVLDGSFRVSGLGVRLTRP